MIRFMYPKGNCPTKMYSELVSDYGNEIMSKTHVTVVQDVQSRALKP